MSRRTLIATISLLFAAHALAQQLFFREVAIPAPGSAPTDVAQAPQGAAVLFTELEGNKIGLVLPDVVEEYPIPTPNSGPMAITYVQASTLPSNPAGFEFWFTESRANRIGRLRYLPNGDFIPELPSVTFLPEIAIPTPNSEPRGIVHGIERPSQRGIAWFTEFEGNKIGRAADDGTITEFSIPTSGSGPWGIAFDRTTDQVWFTEFRANKIGRLDPATGTITEFSIPTPNSGPVEIVYSGGNLWFTESNAGKIGRVSPDGTIVEYPLPDPSSEPWGITRDVSGGAWFTERAAGRVGRITPDGAVREFLLPTPSVGPTGIDMPFVFFGPPRFFVAETAAAKIAISEADHVVVVGAGNTGPTGPGVPGPGPWDTEFQFSNPRSYSVGLTYSPFGPFPGPCLGASCARPTLVLPAFGAAERFASGVLRFSAIETWSISPSGFDLPTVKTRILNRENPMLSADLPAVRYSTIAALDPSVLSFPGAEKSAAGARSNLVLTNLLRPEGSMIVLVEIFSAAGDLLGSETVVLDSAATLFLTDIVGRSGVGDLRGGHVRATKVGGAGLLWGLLATIREDSTLTLALGANP